MIDRRSRSSRDAGWRKNPMPSQSEFEEHFAQLTHELEALEAQLAASELGKHFADIKRRIKVLYEAMRENRLLLETVLENSAASICIAVFPRRGHLAIGRLIKGRIARLAKLDLHQPPGFVAGFLS